MELGINLYTLMNIKSLNPKLPGTSTLKPKLK